MALVAFAYSVFDWTPTERREDAGQGDPEPHTVALRIVRDAVQRVRGESGGGPDRLTAREVWERLGEEMTGQARKTPSAKTVKRWLDRWVASGVLVEGKQRVVLGSDKPVPSYSLPPLARVRCPSMRVFCPLLPENGCRNRKKERTILRSPKRLSVPLNSRVLLLKAKDTQLIQERVSFLLFQSPRAISASKHQRTAPQTYHARAHARQMTRSNTQTGGIGRISPSPQSCELRRPSLQGWSCGRKLHHKSIVSFTRFLNYAF